MVVAHGTKRDWAGLLHEYIKVTETLEVCPHYAQCSRICGVDQMGRECDGTNSIGGGTIHFHGNLYIVTIHKTIYDSKKNNNRKCLTRNSRMYCEDRCTPIVCTLQTQHSQDIQTMPWGSAMTQVYSVNVLNVILLWLLPVGARQYPEVISMDRQT